MSSAVSSSSPSFLTDLWIQIITNLSQHTDSKKIISFLSKCAVIAIDDNTKHVIVGIPNEFIGSQVKKFFLKSLTDIVQECYNPQFRVRLDIHQAFQNGKDPLLLDLTKVLGIKKTKEKE